MVQSIIKENETERVKSYVEAGCVNAYDSAQSVSQMNMSLSGLQEHIVKAKSILVELGTLVDNAGILLRDLNVSLAAIEKLSKYYSENIEQELIPESSKIIPQWTANFDAAGCASLTAVIYSMVKQDYWMQERIVSSLGLKSLSGELDSYCLMWLLRPFVNDEIIHDAINSIK